MMPSRARFRDGNASTDGILLLAPQQLSQRIDSFGTEGFELDIQADNIRPSR
jgi:hypothetical protein